jgi:RNA polymerase sigma-70 factor (ECF subfamily)
VRALPRHNVIPATGARAMTKVVNESNRYMDSGKSGLTSTAASAGALAQQCSHPPADRHADAIRDGMVALLPRLRQFAYTLTRDRERSEDLLQETFVRALRHLDQWRPGSRLDSWLFRIAQNLWIDELRSEKSHGEVVDIATLGNLSDCDGRIVTECRLVLREVRTRIAEMPNDLQVLLRLVWVEGLSCREAAEALDSPPDWVTKRLARARQTLHERTGRQSQIRYSPRNASQSVPATNGHHSHGRAAT